MDCYSVGVTSEKESRLALGGTSADEMTIGPLIGLLISRSKLEAVLAGRQDTVYCRYARYAREIGATLIFFAESDVDPNQAVVRGYVHDCTGSTGCQWAAARYPIPRVIYDRCFGEAGREQAARMRVLARELGTRVVNNLPKITKLQAFAVLSPYPELARYLPFTAPLTAKSLAAAMKTYSDLYLKPDALYKGIGVHRLIRQKRGWVVHSRSDLGNETQSFSNKKSVQEALAPLRNKEAHYLVQEGLPLATYLGNRFDFRSLVQKNGQGAWTVTGLVARIAPEGSVITSPRSGGQIALADRVLRHAFPSRWAEIAADLERVSVELCERLDSHLGPCIELGLDLAVVEDGAVKLIEANGKPLRVSLTRLKDPLVGERIERCPIHSLAHLASQGVGE